MLRQKIIRWFHRIKNALTPTRWMILLLGLKRFSTEDDGSPGLILAQIDGLSHPDFQKALREGRLPFIRKLCARERYQLYHHYAGLPSSTPNVQGELFYGVHQCVPAFQYRNRASGKIFTLYDVQSARQVEDRLRQTGTGLLKSGSSHGNIFSGDAMEPHFCIGGLGWRTLKDLMNPYRLAVILLFNLHVLVRCAACAVLETVLAIYDFFRGIAGGHNFWKELSFVPTRVVVSVLLREVITTSVKIDIARGIPIIHFNLFSYDEQAHRRGPSSKFAHWTLRGIDKCLEQIWKTAHALHQRDYDMWFYSDHGQDEMIPYPRENGRSVQEAVNAAFEKMISPRASSSPESPARQRDDNFTGAWDPRSRWGRIYQNTGQKKTLPDKLVVTALGPLGHLYLPYEIDENQKIEFEKLLEEEARIPLILSVDPKGRPYAYKTGRRFLLPQEAENVLGRNHPFIEETGKEMADLCRHPDSGEFILCGWRPDGKTVSFPWERGSHGGPGAHELDGFALLPSDTPLKSHEKAYLRAGDLRGAALSFLNPSGTQKNDLVRRLSVPISTFTIMTYNVHCCIGMDGRVSTDKIARIIARHKPDVVALQELDLGRARTKGIDQARMIAKRLNMFYHFAPALRMEEGAYGNAVLSRFPLRLIRAASLPHLQPNLERRGALWVEVDLLGRRLQVITTHLSLWRQERRLQVEALLDRDWLGHADCREPLVLCGDFNAGPSSHVYRCLTKRLRDVQTAYSLRPTKTWAGRYPLLRIDHIFTSKQIRIERTNVPRLALERSASDHLPLIAELTISLPEKNISGTSNLESEKANIAAANWAEPLNGSAH